MLNYTRVMKCYLFSFNFFVRFSYVGVLLTSQGHRRNLLAYVISWKLHLS